ncbi:MAG: hypothetical protein JJE17_09920 [Peptostreptococcaceae bacterium]|nr:hypothetical protein [Peptostreptococcaceae bacterium]
MPCYIFDDFITACKKGERIIIWQKVVSEAYKDFGFWDEESIISFIANDGLEELKFQNSEEWRNNPSPITPIMIDAYRFSTLGKVGYIAFFCTNTGGWSIKSFKRSTEFDGSLTIF